jgi:hypothetical protein
MPHKILRPAFWLLGIAVLAVAVGWLVWFSTLSGGDRLWHFSSPPTEQHLTRVLGGERVVAILKDPDRVEAVLLDEPKTFAGAYPEPREYDVVSEPYSVAPETARSISQTLTTPELHRFIDPGTKSCIPYYGVRITYHRGEDRLDLYFCFTCMDLAIYFNGAPVGAMQFLFTCKRLLKDMQTIFPDQPKFIELEDRCLRTPK